MTICSYKNCFEPVFKDGFCETHYEHEQRIEANRFRRHQAASSSLTGGFRF